MLVHMGVCIGVRERVYVCVCVVCIGGGELNKSPCCHGVHKNKWQVARGWIR